MKAEYIRNFKDGDLDEFYNQLYNSRFTLCDLKKLNPDLYNILKEYKKTHFICEIHKGVFESPVRKKCCDNPECIEQFKIKNANIGLKVSKSINQHSEIEVKTKINKTKVGPKPKIKQRNTSDIKDLYDKLKTLDIDIKLLESNDLDIFIPCINLGINYISFNNLDSTEPNYNLKITKKYKALGIDVFHIFESDNIDLWISMIKNKLHKNIKIPARSCVVKQITNKDLKDFLDLNHLQGYCNAVIAYGLYKDSDLVACMTFSKPRFNKAYQYELIRFCVKQGITIQGGASKLFKAFLRDYKPISVISYANRRCSKGFIYETLGFKLMRETYPNYYYINESNVYARQKFQKHKLKELFDKNIIKYYNESETESVIMSKNGFSKVYDAGNLTYILNLDSDLKLNLNLSS